MTIVRRFAPPLALLAFFCALGFVSSANAQRTFRATLDGGQQVPAATTSATGTGTVFLNAAETQISLTLNFSGLTSNMIASHIHSPGARGVNSGVYIDIGSNGSTAASFTISNIPVSPAEVANLKNGLWYFNVHTANFGGGEIRGQIEPDCSPLAPGIASWYRGEGNALDQNNQSNGTLDGATFTAGTTGQAFSLNGNGARVQLGNPTNLQLQDFTIEAWIKRSSATIVTNNPFPGVNAGTFIAFGQDGYGFIIDEATSKLILTKVGVSFAISPNLTVTGTNYHHVAVTKSGSTVTFYVDGVADTPISYNPVFTFSSNVAIGARGDGNLLNSFFGSVDELSVFSSVLTTSQIAAIYNAGVAGKCPACTGAPIGLVSWWSGDGNALDGRSRNNGSLANGATFAEGSSRHAFSFDGNGEIDVPDAPNLNPSTNVSLEAWVFPATDSTGGNAMSIILNKESGSVQYELGRRLSSGSCPSGGGIPTGNFAVYLGGLTGFPDDCGGWADSGGKLPLNTWSHVAVTYDGTNVRTYVGGALTRTMPATGSILSGSGIFRIGKRILNSENWIGRLDEIALYNRVLTSPEIARLSNAGSSCKCKPGATVAPSGVVGWWGGDGDARDISGNFNGGTLQNGAAIAIGEVGQAFSFGGDAPYVEIPDAPSNSVSGEITIEAWIKPGFIVTTQAILSKYDSGGSQLSYFFGMQGDELELAVYGTGDGSLRRLLDTTNSNIPTGTFTHVAATFNPTGQVMKIYVNGVEAPATVLPVSNTVPSIFDGTAPVRIGAVAGNSGILPFNGTIDEATLYNRALTQAEVASIFNAGLAGKLKQVVQPSGPPPRPNGKGDRANVSPLVSVATVGDASVILPTVTVAGTTQQLVVDTTKLPPMPFFTAGLTYDISTTATFTGSPNVCFNLPSFTNAEFADLAILHLENDNWVNRTAAAFSYPNLCTSALPSLSPFAIVKLHPTAANTSVGGRVMTSGGSGVSKATVFLTDSNGVTQTAKTSSLGYFKFEDVQAGQTYVVVIGHKRYTFAPRIVTVEDEITELDFVAIE